MELKRCPFCGGEADTFLIPENTPNENARHPDWTWKYPGMWIVGCNTSGCYGNKNNYTMCFFGRTTAIKTWNRRADDGK